MPPGTDNEKSGGQTKKPMSLSARQSQIASALSEGKTDKEIAADLEISPHTVNDHLKKMYRKMNVSCRAAAVARFLRGSPLMA